MAEVAALAEETTMAEAEITKTSQERMPESPERPEMAERPETESAAATKEHEGHAKIVAEHGVGEVVHAGAGYSSQEALRGHAEPHFQQPGGHPHSESAIQHEGGVGQESPSVNLIPAGSNSSRSRRNIAQRNRGMWDLPIILPPKPDTRKQTYSS